MKAIFNVAFLNRLKSDKTDVYFGTASFVDAHTISVVPLPKEGETAPGEPILLRGDNILIGTGSSPVRPATFPFDECEIYDSDSILALDCIPKTMAVIGAGVIGSE